MSEVQHKMDQEVVEQEAAEKEPQQWKEVVVDIWRKHLPHFRGDVYVGDGDYMFDAATGEYGFQHDSGSEGEDDLMGEDKDEEKESDGEFSVVPGDEQPASAMPSHTSARDNECECIHVDHTAVHNKFVDYVSIYFEIVALRKLFLFLHLHSVQTNAGS